MSTVPTRLRRSPVAAASLALFAVVLAAGLLFVRRRPADRPVGATAARGAGDRFTGSNPPPAAPPRFVTPDLPALPAAKDRSLVNGLHPRELAEIARVDWSVREKVFETVGLTPEQVAKARPIYEEADQAWLAAERQADPVTGRLSSALFEELHRVHAHVTIELMHALGTHTATRMRDAERSAYREMLTVGQRATRSELALLVARRRLEQQHHRLAD